MLDGELDDWLQVPLKDAFRLSFSLTCTPTRLIRFCIALMRETLSKRDRFGQGETSRMQDIGGSMAFHRLEPAERRLLAGFPPPQTYLSTNLARRAGINHFPAPIFPDPAWSWLSHIEPYANIPCRSIHMLEFATAIAKEKNVPEVSLFVGEIHNTDMEWLACYRTSRCSGAIQARYRAHPEKSTSTCKDGCRW
jgi:hypothetical protein